MKILEWLTSFIAWLQIVFSPLFFGLVLGLIVYGIYPTKTGLILGIAIAVLGLTVGIIFATRIWKKLDFTVGEALAHKPLNIRSQLAPGAAFELNDLFLERLP